MRHRVLRSPRTITATTSETCRGPRSRVWSIIMPAEVSLRLYPTARLAGRLPGTPAGLGEIQYTVFDDPDKGRTVAVAEVVEYDHERRALTRSLVGQGVTSTVETTVEDAPSGDVVVTHRYAMELPAGAHRHFVKEYQALLDDETRRLASTLTEVLGV